MEKSYYDWLEINKNASPEIIEKAYKTLAKKYHPDLQDPSKKQECEEILKHINEAYEVLSDEFKKKEYDNLLNEQQMDFEKISREKDILEEELKNLKNSQINNNQYVSSYNNADFNKNNIYSNSNTTENNYKNKKFNSTNNDEYNRLLNESIQKAYYDAYIQDLKNRGYKIRYKKTFKDYLRIFITLIVIIIVFAVIVQLPFVQNYFINLYNENEIIRIFVDFFKKS